MSDELTSSERRAIEAWLPMPPPAGFADRVLAAREAAPLPSRPRRRVAAAAIGAAVAAAAVAVVVVMRPGPARAPQAVEPLALGGAPVTTDAGPAPIADAPPARRPLAPTTADLRVPAGDGGTIHDPRGRVSLELEYAGQCPNGAVVEVSPGAKLAPLPPVRGRDSVILELDTGRWAYTVECETTPPSPVLAQGEFLVVRDAADRPLPAVATTKTIDADGRTYRISYQRTPPSLRVRGQRTNDPTYRLRVSGNGVEQIYDAQGPTFVVPAFTLREGTYALRMDDGPGAKVTTVVIERDWTAPQVSLRSPGVDESWGGELVVEGMALPGWSASIDGVEVPKDSDGTFSARLLVQPGAKALAIRVVHYTRGVHYYLRRPGP